MPPMPRPRTLLDVLADRDAAQAPAVGPSTAASAQPSGDLVAASVEPSAPGQPARPMPAAWAPPRVSVDAEDKSPFEKQVGCIAVPLSAVCARPRAVLGAEGVSSRVFSVPAIAVVSHRCTVEVLLLALG